MSICTCKYCLCFFNVVVVGTTAHNKNTKLFGSTMDQISSNYNKSNVFVRNFAKIVNTIMLAWLISTYIIFGNMPPSYTMAIGFWLLLYTNFFGIYVALLAEATFYRNQDIWWINRLTEGGIIACIVCFFLGSILFFIPLTAEAMMSFSKTYNKLYGEIPPFLDTMQAQFKCCGIYDYRDYGRKDWTNMGYGEEGFIVYRQANPNDDFFHELIYDLTQNRTVERKTTGLDVPQSCCITEKALNPREQYCGERVEYTNSKNEKLAIKQRESAIAKINDPGMGCFQKYQNIWETGYQFQLTYLIGMIQWMSLVQSFLHFALWWFHRLALKTIRQLNYWLPELLELHDNAELARAHANLEAEADAAHGRSEVKVKRSKSRSKSIHRTPSKNLKTTKSAHKQLGQKEKKDKRTRESKDSAGANSLGATSAGAHSLGENNV